VRRQLISSNKLYHDRTGFERLGRRTATVPRPSQPAFEEGIRPEPSHCPGNHRPYSHALTIAATVKPNGNPHLSPSDLVSVNEILYVGIDEATTRFKNLKQNSAITLMIADGWERQAILEGKVKFLDMKSGAAKNVLDAQKKKYGWITDALAEFIPEKAFTYKAK